MTGCDVIGRQAGGAPATRHPSRAGVTSAPVGVVIPAYNRRHEIVRALDSVAAQTRPPGLVVVVDDGSTDGTADTVADWFAMPRPFETLLVRQSNSGVSVARNAGWEHIGRFEYIAFLDSDDAWPPDFLEKAIEALNARPDAVAAVSDRLTFQDGKGQTQSDNLTRLCTDTLWWFFRYGAGVLSCSLLRASAARQIGQFDPELYTGQDAAFLLRLSLKGPWVRSESAPVHFYRDYQNVRDGEGNLSLFFGDNFTRWARIYETFYLEQKHAIPRRKRRALCRELAVRWRKAGKQRRNHREPVRAMASYGRSIWWRIIATTYPVPRR